MFTSRTKTKMRMKSTSLDPVSVVGVAPKRPIPITVDCAEKLPLRFHHDYATVTTAHLKTFDYAVTGDDKWAIERKTISDLVGSFVSNGARERRKIERARKQFDSDWPLLYVIDGMFEDLINYDWYRCPRATSQWFVSNLTDMSQQLGVHFQFCESRQVIMFIIYRWLKTRYKHLQGTRWS